MKLATICNCNNFTIFVGICQYNIGHKTYKNRQMQNVKITKIRLTNLPFYCKMDLANFVVWSLYGNKKDGICRYQCVNADF